jgi:ABC-2 type transport system permease protein
MRNIGIIFVKELRGYFVSPIAYLLLALFGIISAFFFWIYVRGFVQYGMEMQMSGQMYPMNLNDLVIRPVVSNLAVIGGLLFIPLITMRLFAEEKRNGTIELLTTSPIRDSQVILGKWLAALVLYSCLLAFTAIDFVWLFIYGNPDWKPLAICYLGLFLQAGAMLAIGTFLSTLTRNQIIAGATTFAVFVLLWVMAAVGEFGSSTWLDAISYLSINSHFESFERGVLVTKDLVFYFSMIFLGLFLTARSMESLRWRS